MHLGHLKADIIIKPADTSGKIVLWPTEQYLAEATKQLSDTNYYLEQSEDHTIQLHSTFAPFSLT